MAPKSQPPHPTLSPQFCLSPDSLRSFLRLSRAAIDDPISQHLSSLSHPSATPFDPSSISAARPANASRKGLPPATCAGFVSHTLFPAWAARARVLEYCGGVAEKEMARSAGASGEEDKEAVSNTSSVGHGQWGGTVTGGSLSIGAGVVGPEAEAGSPSQRPSPAPDGQAWSSHRIPRVVDERLDPYSARDYSDGSPGERLARTIREEKSVETIVRARSWGVVKDRCGAAMEGWEEGMKTWEGEMDKAHSRGAEDAGSGGGKSAFSRLWS